LEISAIRSPSFILNPVQGVNSSTEVSDQYLLFLPYSYQSDLSSNCVLYRI
jgi:hypothetical protein